MIGCIFCCWQPRMEGFHVREGKGRRKGAVHIKRCVVKKMSVKLHTLRMKVAAVLPGGGEIGMWCVFLEVQKGRCVVGLRDADFILNYTLGRKKLTLAIFPHVLQLCKDQEDLFLLVACPSPETVRLKKRKWILGCAVTVDHHWCQMSNTSSKIIRLTFNDSDSCFIDNYPAQIFFSFFLLPDCLWLFLQSR